MVESRSSGDKARQRLILLAKPPLPGLVKTRLIGPLSPTAVAELYAAFVADLVARLATGPWRLTVVHPPGADGAALGVLADGAAEVRPEPVLTAGPRDLGVAMRDSIAGALSDGAARVVLIGSDVPQLPRDVVAEAFEALREFDLVLGPDTGGGFYLFGARRPPELLTPAGGGPIAWSAGTDYREVTERARALGLSVAEVKELYDIDGPMDLDRLRAELAAGRLNPADLPRTAAWLCDTEGG